MQKKKKKNHVDSTMQLIEHQYIIKKKKKNYCKKPLKIVVDWINVPCGRE